MCPNTWKLYLPAFKLMTDKRAEGWSWLLEVSGSPCTPSAGFWRDGKRLQLKFHLLNEIMIVANREWENDQKSCRHGIGLYLKKLTKILGIWKVLSCRNIQSSPFKEGNYLFEKWLPDLSLVLLVFSSTVLSLFYSCSLFIHNLAQQPLFFY